jgi:hypothetical protein
MRGMHIFGANGPSVPRMGWKDFLFLSAGQLADELVTLGLKIASKAIRNAGPKELL